MREDILSRIYNGIPYLRFENYIKDATKDAEITLTIEIPSNNNKEMTDMQHFYLQLVNYGNGPAINVCIEDFGLVSKIIKKRKHLQIIPKKRLLQESMMVDFIGSWGRDIAIRMGDSVYIQFIARIYNDSTNETHVFTVKNSENETWNTTRWTEDRYYLEFSYESLSDKNTYVCFVVFKPTIISWGSGKTEMGLKMEKTYNGMRSSKKHNWHVRGQEDEIKY